MRWLLRTTAVAACLVLPLSACAGDPAPADGGALPATVWSTVKADLSVDEDADSLRAFLVNVDGEPALEKYLDSSAEDHWDVQSVTKSVVSTLIGIAIGEGAISGTDATLGELMPSYADRMPAYTRGVTVGELLSMTSGLPPAGETGTAAFDAARPVDAMLRLPNPSRRGTFQYSNEGFHLLGAVLEEATGTPLLEYATSRLFTPLGIATDPTSAPVLLSLHPTPAQVQEYLDADFTWPVDRTGLPVGSSFLKLRPADLVRIGQLWLDEGRWRGRQVVPAEYVAAASRAQVRTPGNPSGYGYGWWVGEADGAPAFMAQGYGGQLIEVVPSRGLVVVATTELSYVDDLGSDGLSSTTLTFAVSDAVVPAVGPSAG